MALELKVDGVTVPDRTTSARADDDAIMGEDLRGWAAYLMNAASSSARELVQAADVLIAAASEVDLDKELLRSEAPNFETIMRHPASSS
jgi:hypothetical protein